MPKGHYERKPKEATAADQLEVAVTTAQSIPLPLPAVPEMPKALKGLGGRSVYRIMLHNGVHLGLPPNARVEKSILSASSPYAKPLGRPLASSMTLTPGGVHVIFAGEIEKLIPYANIYEADLAPEGA